MRKRGRKSFRSAEMKLRTYSRKDRSSRSTATRFVLAVPNVQVVQSPGSSPGSVQIVELTKSVPVVRQAHHERVELPLKALRHDLVLFLRIADLEKRFQFR
jgi:hypothetical protein